MSRSQVASFAIACTRILRADGSIEGDTPDWAQDRGELVRLYRAMVLARTFDAKAVALQRTGRLGTYASSPRPGGRRRRHRRRDAAGGRVRALVPRIRRAALARRAAARDAPGYWGGDERGNAFAGPPARLP